MCMDSYRKGIAEVGQTSIGRGDKTGHDITSTYRGHALDIRYEIIES